MFSTPAKQVQKGYRVYDPKRAGFLTEPLAKVVVSLPIMIGGLCERVQSVCASAATRDGRDQRFDQAAPH
jgi:hypothetical protein